MAIIKSLLYSIFYYLFFLASIVLIKYIGGVSTYGELIPNFWISALILLVIFAVIFVKSTKITVNRPRSALLFGFVLLLFTAGADYVFLVKDFAFLSNIIPIDSLDGLARDSAEIFDSISFDSLYMKNQTALIVRYAMMFLIPFFISLFLPKPDETLPAKK